MTKQDIDKGDAKKKEGMRPTIYAIDRVKAKERHFAWVRALRLAEIMSSVTLSAERTFLEVGTNDPPFSHRRKEADRL